VVAGFGGDLITHAYVEQELLPAAGMSREPLAAFERQLTRWWRQVSRSLGPTSSARTVLDVAVAPLVHLLGHDRPVLAPHPLGLCGSVSGSAVSLIVLPWSAPVATAWRDAAKHAIAGHTTWAMVSNGRSLRIVDCTRTWTRLGLEFDFEILTASPKGVAALWWLANAETLRTAGAGSLRARVAASDAHAARVCHSLGNGVLGALPHLASALTPGASTRHAAATLDQALTIVYRILFLLFAEARGAVPVWHELYRDAYTIEALTRQAGKADARGLWAALQAISRLAHAGCKAADLDVTAFNGRLFSPRHAPLVEQRRVPDAVVRDVLLALATESTPQGLRRISYHDLGVEQLGSVYERVLEFEPRSRGVAMTLSRTSIERKATGSFYTPRSITEFLVRRTLSPLVEGRAFDRILELRVLDPAMGSGAFLVASCQFLADRCERALIEEGRWSAGDVRPSDRAALKRQVAEQCLYGVDLNPTAVQLARLSMWLTTLAADRPLTFLDHHLAAGNSLLGASITDLSRPATPARRARTTTSLPLFDDQLAEIVAHRVMPARLQLALTPSDSVEAVKGKERTLAALSAADGPISGWWLAADLWCAARFWPGTPPPAGLVSEWIAAATGSPTTLPAAQLRESMRTAREVAQGHGAFHWELAFPEIFFDGSGRLKPDGGFDAVLGNPPWDMLRADLGSSVDRAEARARTTAALRFYRASRAYSLQGDGHANRYQLFLERAMRLTKPAGRIGMILPSGIATDHGSAALRKHLLDRTAIDTWIGFDNRRRIFPIHRSMRFVVLSTSNTGRTDALTFRCGLTDAGALEQDAAAAPQLLTISRSRLEAWSPDILAIPEIPDAVALSLISGISSRIPALADPAGWNVRFGRELNATDDRPHFVPLTKAGPRTTGSLKAASICGEELLPIVEGKLLAPFHADLDRATLGIAAKAAAKLIDRASFERPRIAYRDVASATNKLTLIAALLPAGAVSTHTVFVSKGPLGDRARWCLLGLMNSFVANYLVRLNVTTHVTASLMARLPVPRPPEGSEVVEQLVELSQVLAAEGVEAGREHYARLNAIAASLYGLTVEEYQYVAGTFPLIDEQIRSASVEILRSLHRAVLPRLQ
jgi:hypothetical protein